MSRELERGSEGKDMTAYQKCQKFDKILSIKQPGQENIELQVDILPYMQNLLRIFTACRILPYLTFQLEIIQEGQKMHTRVYDDFLHIDN